MSQGRVLVIGGGVVGTACAYYLAKDDWQVTVIDRGEHGRGCSHANCGFVSPSHVLPLAAPGAVKTALASLLQADAPLRIKPRFDPSLWSWLARFALRCNRDDMLAAGRGIAAILNSSRKLYDQLFTAEAIDCEWEPRGLIFVYKTRAGFEHYAQIDELLRKLYDAGARRLDGAELAALEPALLPGLGGGWLYENDAHLRPDKLLTGWRRVIESLGVEIREHCAVEAFRCAGNRLAAVQTSHGEIAADRVVVATGAWTPRFARDLGCRIPIQPGKGYSITMPRPARCPKYPLIFEEHRVAVTPFRSGYRLGSTMEFAGYDETLNRRRLDYLTRSAREYLHDPVAAPVQQEWYGWRPMTYDGLPIVDRSPALDNVWIAAGHNMLGLSMATGTGKLISEMIGGRKPHLDASPYSARRFM